MNLILKWPPLPDFSGFEPVAAFQSQLPATSAHPVAFYHADELLWRTAMVELDMPFSPTSCGRLT